MRGSADVDGDGAVTLAELYRYGYTRTLRDTHARAMAVQHSELDVRLSGHGDLVITSLAKAASIVELGPKIRGHLLLIHDSSGRIAGEYQWSEGDPSRLAIPSGRYRVQLRNDEAFRVGLFEVGAGINRLTIDRLAVQEQRVAQAKGSSLDPLPLRLAFTVALERAPVDGFGLQSTAAMALTHHVAEGARVGAELAIGYAFAQTDPWHYDQITVAPSLAGDLVFGGEVVSFTTGLRLGVLIVQQYGSRPQGALSEMLGAEPEARNIAVGPRLGADVAVEVHTSKQVNLRVGITPSIAMLPIDGSLSPVWGLGASIGAIARL